MTNNPSRRNHTVPSFYLKNFSSKKGTNYFVYCYDKLKDITFNPNINNITIEIDGYIVKEFNIKLSIEEGLAEAEARHAEVISKVVKNPTLSSLSQEEKIQLSDFVALQIIRTPVKDIEIQQIIDGAISKFPTLKNQFDTSKKSKKIIKIKDIIENTKTYSKMLQGLKWIIIENKTDDNFITSDNPVVRHNLYKTKFFGNLGLLCKGIQIIIPLSPQILLLMIDEKAHKPVPEYMTASKENIMYYNCAQITNSIRFLISKTDDFNMVKQYLKDYPDLKNPNRKRILVN